MYAVRKTVSEFRSRPCVSTATILEHVSKSYGPERDQEYCSISNVYTFTSLPHNGHKTLAEPRKVGLWYFHRTKTPCTTPHASATTFPPTCTCIPAVSRRHDHIAVAFPSNNQNVPNSDVRRSRTADPISYLTPLKLHRVCFELTALVRHRLNSTSRHTSSHRSLVDHNSNIHRRQEDTDRSIHQPDIPPSIPTNRGHRSTIKEQRRKYKASHCITQPAF
jgi:hypothetical protein